MSEAFATALPQYEQNLGIRPGTLCAYDVEADGIADLTDPDTLRAIGVEPADLECPQGGDFPTRRAKRSAAAAGRTR